MRKMAFFEVFCKEDLPSSIRLYIIIDKFGGALYDSEPVCLQSHPECACQPG